MSEIQDRLMPEQAGEPKKQVILYQECPVCAGAGCRVCKVKGVIETGVTESQVEYISKLDVLRQEAGISAAMLRDGRARTLVDAAKEVERLRSAIRKHRDYRGDHRCWMDDEELYNVLPEGYTPPERDAPVELKNCQRFIACRHNPGTVYVSPDEEIERLRTTLKRLDERGGLGLDVHKEIRTVLGLPTTW